MKNVDPPFAFNANDVVVRKADLLQVFGVVVSIDKIEDQIFVKVLFDHTGITEFYRPNELRKISTLYKEFK